jgi:predicted transcriptional regulator with HTH domain
MTRKTYIGTPHRDSISGQSLVSVSDGRKAGDDPLNVGGAFNGIGRKLDGERASIAFGRRAVEGGIGVGPGIDQNRDAHD